VSSQLITVCAMPGRWSLSPRTVWKTSTTFSVFSCSNRMLTVMNVPVLPQPPLHIQTHKAVRVSNTQGSMCIKHTRKYVYQTHKTVSVFFSSLVSEVFTWNHNWNLHFVCGFISYFLSIHTLLVKFHSYWECSNKCFSSNVIALHTDSTKWIPYWSAVHTTDFCICITM